MKNQMIVKYLCGCIVQAQWDTEGLVEARISDNCITHNEPIIFMKPHSYKGNLTLVCHKINDFLYYAVHECRKDEYGFVDKLASVPITAIYPICLEGKDGYGKESIRKELWEKTEHLATEIEGCICDICCMADTFPKHLLVEAQHIKD